MNDYRTTALCPECYSYIPATITIGEQAVMIKECPVHGSSSVVIENDGSFYRMCRNNHEIYPGLLVDVTYKCNLRCKWCFQNLRDEEPNAYEIMVKVNGIPKGYPVILSGGEPTLRKDLEHIVNLIAPDHPVSVLTNGYNIDESLPCEWVLSYHKENRKLFSDALQNATRPFRSIIFTVDNITDMLLAVDDCCLISGHAHDFRIHMASPVGADSGKDNTKVFVSDMVKAVIERYPKDTQIHGKGKTVYQPVKVGNTVIMLIAWPDVGTIDLQDLDCAPYYHDNKGEVRHLVTALIMNQSAL